MKKTIYPLIFLTLLSSCFKKEKGITLPFGETTISTCSMGTDKNHYSKQMYFDLGSNTFQESQLADWDMCFESSDAGIGIFINTMDSIKICKADFYNLNEPQTSDPFNIATVMKDHELIDGSDGRVETSAIGDWRKYSKSDGMGGTIYGIYYIELTNMPESEKYKRLQVLNSDDSFFYIKLTGLQNNNPPTTIIRKNKLENFTYYSFKNGGHIVDNIEPPKTSWDFVFTRYKTMIPLTPNSTILYPVAGVFSNRNKVTVAIDSTNKFENINTTNLPNYYFKADRDAIGSAWKTYSYSNGSKGIWTVYSNITYIIIDTDKHYYKLRFLDFVDKQQISGNPKFEYIQIK